MESMCSNNLLVFEGKENHRGLIRRTAAEFNPLITAAIPSKLLVFQRNFAS